MKEKKGFVVYSNWRDYLAPMTDSEKGELLSAMFDYNIDGVVPEFENPWLSSIFSVIRSAFDNDREKYEKTCERNAKIARKRWEKEKQSESPQQNVEDDGLYNEKSAEMPEEQDEILKNLRINPPKLYK